MMNLLMTERLVVSFEDCQVVEEDAQYDSEEAQTKENE